MKEAGTSCMFTELDGLTIFVWAVRFDDLSWTDLVLRCNRVGFSNYLYSLRKFYRKSEFQK